MTAPVEGRTVGKVTAGATSPYLGHGIGIGLLDTDAYSPGTEIMVGCRDGSMQSAEVVELPFYNKAGEIPRGKREDITQRA
ncbi:MAG: glycine cleavage T C-terminal barrel domain-containing protein [Filomicrobium sp.]